MPSSAPRPDHRHIGDRPVGDPGLLAVEHPLRRRRAAPRVSMPAGFDPNPGSVSPKQPIASPDCSRGSHRCFCSSLAVVRIGYITSAPCTLDETAQAGIAALQLLHDQPVLDVAHSGAAVAFQIRAEEAQLGPFPGSVPAEIARRGSNRGSPASRARRRTGAPSAAPCSSCSLNCESISR